MARYLAMRSAVVTKVMLEDAAITIALSVPVIEDFLPIQHISLI